MPGPTPRDLIAFELNGESFDALARSPSLSAAAAEALAAGHRVERNGNSALRVTCFRPVGEELLALLQAEARTALGPGGWERALACAAAARDIEIVLAGLV